MLDDDFIDQPIVVIKNSDNTFKFYPNYNKEAIKWYLEYIREEQEKKDRNYCGAV
jgi:hypothetical protein